MSGSNDTSPSVQDPVQDPGADIDRAAFTKAAREALRAFAVRPKRLRLWSVSENVVFRVDEADGGRSTLRLHRPGYHSLAELEAEQAWTTALAKAGIAVPVPRRTPDGEGYVGVQVGAEYRHAGLLGWVDGEPLADIIDAADSQAIRGHFMRMGRVAGQIHNVSSAWSVPEGFVRHRFDVAGFVGEQPFWGRFWDILGVTAKQREMLQVARAWMRTELEQLAAASTPATTAPTVTTATGPSFAMIHADLHSGNVLVDGDVLRVIDFDDAGFGHQGYEWAVALFEFRDKPELAGCSDAFLEGYAQVCTPHPADVKSLPVFMLMRALALLGWVEDRPELHRRESYQASLLDFVARELRQRGVWSG